MKRHRGTQLAEQLLATLEAGRDEWPLSLVTEVYVFGSYACGATDPHDLDIEVEINRQDDRWLSHFAACLSYGRDPDSLIRQALVGSARSYQFLFEARDRVDFPLTLLWRQRDRLSVAIERLHAIQVDDSAGRAPRDAMLPQFDGLDRWIPRPYRERLALAIEAGAITLQITSALRTRSARSQGDDQAIRGLLQLLGELFRDRKLAEQPVGALVTLDRIYEVQHTALDSDVQASMARVLSQCADDADGLMVRAARRWHCLSSFRTLRPPMRSSWRSASTTASTAATMWLP